MDDTLMDFRQTEDYALAQSFAESYRPLTQVERAIYDRINHELWASLERGEVSLPFLKVERFARFFSEAAIPLDPTEFSGRFALWLGRGIFLLPGAEAICAYLSQKYKLVLVSNGIQEVQYARIQNSPLAAHIKTFAVSEEAGYGKPDPRIFEYACAKIGHWDKAKMLMVGDSLSSDIQGGLRFGIDTCWVNPKGSPPSPGLAPTYTISRLAELSALL